MHAILIIIMWPLPYPGPTHDPSWGYCGLAMNAALQMGMHRPGFHREYGFPDLSQEQAQLRTVTWMMAFQTSVCLSTFLGVPPFIDATPHMDAILANTSGLPKVIVAQTDIQLHVARFTRALDNAMELAAKVMYINMFERDLDRLRATFESTWSSNVELNLTSAKLYLYAHIFVSPKRGSTGVEMPPAGQSPHSLLADSGARKIIYSGLAAAVSYIHSFSEEQQAALSPPDATGVETGAPWDASPAATATSAPSTSSPPGPPQKVNRQMYFPHHYWRSLVMASFFLLKFLAVAAAPGVGGEAEAEAEQELARNHLATSYKTFMSYANSIEHVAVAKTLERLVQTAAGVPAEGKVNTRLGASVIFDGLLVFGQLEKARTAGMLELQAQMQMQTQTHQDHVQPQQQAETPLFFDSGAATPGYGGFDNGFSIAEFLDSDWNLPWETNFFDMGMATQDR
ncbi:hypothetical protein B0T24DRAFT_635799 [Lasiosphaeria ovina]|uniref:Xylanolytic transcriptional activator regulatory domain-containing protein n=1 Tax=Lasiosphaeria ovina TaxID=92902 RepID=A0AAE0N1L9_9PEZI|nr:hypothetical protein B0T24DRAFT_635799 [Lasiosphaeria ovina]